MEQQINFIMFALLRMALEGSAPEAEVVQGLSEDRLAQLWQQSARHDISPLTAWALGKLTLPEETKKKADIALGKAAFRYEQQNYALEKLCSVLEKEQIPFLPLKGSVLRRYWPEPWMRTSCDIDVLVRQQDLEKAVLLLNRELGCSQGEVGRNHISMRTPNKILVELHYDLLEGGPENRASQVLKTVWQTVRPQNGRNSFQQEMPDEMFYFYHIAHMAKHFEHGGCGIRPFLDLWILDRQKKGDRSKRDALLAQGGLLKFAEVAQLLSRVWLEGAEHTPVTRLLEAYVLRGGLYGTGENRVTLQQQKKGGRIKYVLSKIFIPYDVIKYHYPVLQKHPWLTPVMEVRRWFKLAFCGHAKRVTREMKFNSSIPPAEAQSMRRFLGELGLQDRK